MQPVPGVFGASTPARRAARSSLLVSVAAITLLDHHAIGDRRYRRNYEGFFLHSPPEGRGHLEMLHNGADLAHAAPRRPMSTFA